jgi:hypothetical protein
MSKSGRDYLFIYLYLYLYFIVEGMFTIVGKLFWKKEFSVTNILFYGEKTSKEKGKRYFYFQNRQKSSQSPTVWMGGD